MRFVRLRSLALSLPLSGLPILAQAPPTTPVVPPRGVVNAYSLAPAPSVASPGGIVSISGLNLAPAEGLKPDSLPAPTKLGDLEVLLNNNRAIPILEATPGRILVQLPWDTPVGTATLTVRRASGSSRAARITIQALAPSLLSADDTGWGAAMAAANDKGLTLRASSLGPPATPIDAGAVTTPDTPIAPRANIYAYIAGLEAPTQATLSTTRPGEFAVSLTLPEGTLPGDPIQLVANNAAANPLNLSGGGGPSSLTHLTLPADAPEIRALRSTDLRGLLLTATGARASNGCYPTLLVDAAAKAINQLDGCPTAAQVNSTNPFVFSNNSSTFAAFEGPFTAPTATPGQPATPVTVSSKIRIFHPSSLKGIEATLPAPAATVNSTEGGNFLAAIPASGGNAAKTYLIDSADGTVTENTPAAGAGAGNGAAVNLVTRFLNLDLGDGYNKLLTTPAQLVNQILITMGDSLDDPKKAKVAVLNAQGDVTAQRDFPNGWLPLTAPAAPTVTPPAGQPAAAAAPRFPTTFYADPASRTYYVAARNADGKHALIAFLNNGNANVINVPDGFFLTSCIAAMPTYDINLANQFAMLASRSEDKTFKNPCVADGYVIVDLTRRTATAVALPGSGQITANGGLDDINDFLTGSNTDPARRNISDTLYVLDGVNATAYRFDLPSGVNNFSGGTRVPALNLLIAQANNRGTGDAGLVVFDLEATQSRLLPTPEGFATVNVLGILQSLRKVVARGIKPNNGGAQILIYNLDTLDLEIIPNPEGITWAGSPPAQAGQGGQGGQQAVNVPVRVNAKANTVEAITYDAARKQQGVLVVRVF